MLANAARLDVSLSLGLSSLTSPIVTCGDGQRPILVGPAAISRYPVSRSTRFPIDGVKNPAGIPVIRINSAKTMMAAIVLPAIFMAFFSTV
jgi:hypothetical protein